MNHREELLVAALLEYIEKFGASEKSKMALDVLGSDEMLKKLRPPKH